MAQLTPKQYFSQDGVKNKLEELLGKRASAFSTSVLQIVNSNAMLKDATNETIFSAACMAATLNLPINNSLGFAYIVPYKNRKAGVTEAQFQLGYKGYIQLAQRSGQFKIISSAAVRDGQLITSDPLKGYVFDWTKGNDEKGNALPTIGYVAYFQLLNGFEAYLYMTVDEVRAHATAYSQTFKRGFGVWADNFEAMALKTVIKLLLSKQAPLSIDTQLSLAIEADQSVIKTVDGAQQFEYIDNEAQPAALVMDVSNDAELFNNIMASVKSGELDKIKLLSGESEYRFNDEQLKTLEAA